MPKDRLTSKQRRLLKELDEVAEFLNLDYRNVLQWEKAGRTPYLEAARDKIVRGQVIIWYTLVDELLAMELADYYFGRKRSYIELWKTKRFRLFNYHVLEELHLLQKLRHVRAVKMIPKSVVATIERLNALRNGLAHAFFPENLHKSAPQWKGFDIFSFDGVRALAADMDEVLNFFLGSEYNVRRLEGE
jgi:hypothetical protein